MIRQGFHPVDCSRVKKKSLQHDPEFVDRNLLKKPFYKINGVKTKQHGVKVVNLVSCGCEYDHNPKNENCAYTCFHTLVEELGDERLAHGLFHCTCNGGLEWSNRGTQKVETVSKSIQRINQRIQFAPGRKITGSMGRKTFITLSRDFFGFQDEKIKDESHHVDHDAYMRYVDGNYVNIGGKTLIGRTFQDWEQGRYVPPRPESFPRRVYNIENRLELLAQSIHIVIALLQKFLTPKLHTIPV